MTEPYLILDHSPRRDGIAYTLVVPASWAIRVRWPRIKLSFWVLRLLWKTLFNLPFEGTP